MVDDTEEREDVRGFDDPAAFAGRGLDTGEPAGRVLKGGCKGIRSSEVEVPSARTNRGVANPDIERF